MKLRIIIDTAGPDTVLLKVMDGDVQVYSGDVPRHGAVDTRLLTVIDSLFKKNILDRFAPVSVKAGPGVDRTSILYRLVLTLDAALGRPRAQNS